MMQEQSDEKPPTIAQILQLHSVGILSIKKARALVNKYYPSEPDVKSEPVVKSEAHGGSYTTPPPKPATKRSFSRMHAIDAEIIQKLPRDCIQADRANLCEQLKQHNAFQVFCIYLAIAMLLGLMKAGLVVSYQNTVILLS